MVAKSSPLTNENDELTAVNQRLTGENAALQARIPPKLPVIMRKLSMDFKTKITDADTINLLYYYSMDNTGAPFPYKNLLKDSKEANLLKVRPDD